MKKTLGETSNGTLNEKKGQEIKKKKIRKLEIANGKEFERNAL